MYLDLFLETKNKNVIFSFDMNGKQTILIQAEQDYDFKNIHLRFYF